MSSINASFIENPYPQYTVWREQGRVVWSDDFFGGAWLVTHHADVEQLLRDTRFSSQRTGGWVNGVQDAQADTALTQRAFQRFFARAFLFLDAPDHPRLRQVLMPAFRPAQLAKIQGDIARWSLELVQQLPSQFDFMQAIARPLPALVIGHLMGIAPGMEPSFTRWAQGLAAFIGAAQPTARQLALAQQCLLEMVEYFERELLPAHAQLPEQGGDMVHDLVRAAQEGRIQNRTELLAQTAMLLFAGYETTRNLLGNGMLAFMQHRDQWELLCQQPELAVPAVRELLRYDSPVQWTGRRASADMVLHGQPIQRGDLLIALIGAANHDPQRYEQPTDLQLQRGQIGALSFGSGAHVCIGAGLTQMETQAMLATLARTCPHLQLAGTPVRDGNPVYRGLLSLPMALS